MDIQLAAVQLGALHAGLSRLFLAELTEPYMDEQLHSMQAQRYCAGDFESWDPAITTFPGLYLWSAALVALARRVRPGFLCSLAFLRTTNLALALLCGPVIAFIVRRIHGVTSSAATRSLHTLLVASLPFHFFYAHLYYTDAGSLLSVLAMYAASLLAVDDGGLTTDGPRAVVRSAVQSPAPPTGRVDSAVMTLVATLGAVAILFRQTNVVWLGFVAATVAVRALRCRELLKSLQSTPGDGRVQGRDGGNGASPSESFIMFFSTRVLLPSAPVVGVVAAFIVYVVLVNGGRIVLGDAEAHAPVIHAAQLAYVAALAGGYCVVDLGVAWLHASMYGRVDPVMAHWLLFLRDAFFMPIPTAAQAAPVGTKVAPASDSTTAVGGAVSDAVNASTSPTAAQSPVRYRRRPIPTADAATPTAPAAKTAHLVAATSTPTAATTATPIARYRSSDSLLYTAIEDRPLRRLNVVIVLASAWLLAIALHYRSYAHPYLLADNRHYTFYVWSRLLGGPYGRVIRPALAPAYVAAAVLSVTRLATSFLDMRLGAAWTLLWALATAAMVVPARLIEPRYFIIPLAFALIHTRYGSRSMITVTLLLHAAINAVTIRVFLARPFTWHDGSIARFMW